MSIDISTISEADVLAYFKAKTEEYAAEFPAMIPNEPFHAGYTEFSERVTLYGYVDKTYKTACGYGKTFAEAAADLRQQIGTPESRAADLREKAAALRAEADKMDAMAQPTP